jgi:hypothetical protein
LGVRFGTFLQVSGMAMQAATGWIIFQAEV